MVFMFYLYYVLNVKYFGQHLLFLPITNSWLWNIHKCRDWTYISLFCTH